MVLDKIYAMEDFINRLDMGKETCKTHYEWKLIELEHDDDIGRENLTKTYQEHVSKLENEKEKVVNS